MARAARVGESRMTSGTKRRNRLLAALPRDELRRIEASLDSRAVEMKQVLLARGAEIDTIYFPVDSVVSLLTGLEDDPGVEIATIGNEGLVGMTVALGGNSMNTREYAVAQVPGQTLAMTADAFRAEMDRRGEFASIVMRYARAFFSQVAQQVACNGLHSIEERCSRWILLTHDRVGADEFPMTQEFLAQMLGVRRASVTVTAGILQRAGFIEVQRGRLRVVDRAGLEAASCECYQVIRDVFDQTLP
jgi:CRP-like cAMP-binding protein